ncbi:fibronectin type III domain-containing protein [Hymenobacter terrigena]
MKLPIRNSWFRLASLLLLFHLPAWAQVDTYTMVPSTGTFTPLPSTATNVPAVQADIAVSSSITLPFTFTFDGTPFQNVVASSNGFLSFNTSATGSDTNDLSHPVSGNNNNYPLLGVYWDDLNGAGAQASYLVSGTAPNRVFTFEWLNWKRYGNAGPSMSMQVKLYETTNVVQYVYRPESAALGTVNASIGLAGALSSATGPASSFLSLQDASAAPVVSSTTENKNIATFPASGQIYTFTPPVVTACPTPRNPTVLAQSATSATVTWSVPSGTGPYTIIYGPTGFNPATGGQRITATTALANITGLTPSTTYQFYVVQNCGGTLGSSGNSAPGSFTTNCSAPLYATLPVTESFENTWINRCDTRDVPNNNWNNDPLTGNNSWRREDDGAAAAWTSVTSGTYTPTGSLGTHSARFHSYSASSGSTGAFDLYVNLSQAGTKRLSFDFINTSGSDSLVVQLSTNGGTSFSRVGGFKLSSGTGFSSQALNINSTSATSIVRFLGKGDFGTTDIGLDNIVLESATGCLRPAGLAATATTATSATVTWLTSGTSPYTIIYGPTGFNPATGGQSITATTAPATITGLTPSTTYQFYVVQNCGGTLGNSSLSAPSSFTTNCSAPLYATLPVTENFENTWINRCDTRDVPNNNWSNTPLTGNNSWRREDDGAAAAWTSVTSGAYTPTGSLGTHSARFHSYYAANGTTGAFDLYANLSPAGAKRLTFDFINTSGSDSLVVQISTDGGLSFSRVGGVKLSSTTGFTNQVFTINSTSATSVVRFLGKSDYGVTDIGLDNIVLESATGCIRPTGLAATASTTTTATLTWLTGGTGTYTLEYGPAGFVRSTGTVVPNLTAPPYTATGLTSGTSYDFYVTLNCAGGTSSTPGGPGSFATAITNDNPCGATVLPITSSCSPLSTTTVGATATTGTGISTSNCAGSNTAPRDVWYSFTTPATGPTSTAVRLSVTGVAASQVQVFSATSCTGTFASIGCSGTSSTAAAPDLDLAGLTPSTTYYARVFGYSSTVALGSFTICATAVPNCNEPVALGADSVASTTARLTWAGGNTPGNTYTVRFGLGPNLSPTGGTVVANLTTQNYKPTGLAPNTNYCFYVTRVCNNFNGSSIQAGPYCFTTAPTPPANDNPCGSVTLTAGTPSVTGTTAGATTSTQAGLNSVPSCAPTQQPNDVWYKFTPAAGSTSVSVNLQGAAAGAVRVFTSPNCASGPFTQVFCRSAGGANGFSGAFSVTGLTAGTTYYMAVSNYATGNPTGTFTMSVSTLGTVTATSVQANTDALLVYPNPSNTGQLTLRLSGLSAAGQATLLNSLGQVVATKALNGTAEQTMSTRGLATGLYTLRVMAGGQVLTRKVVLE